MKKRLLAVLLTTALTMTALVGCGSNGDTPASSSTEKSSSVSSETKKSEEASSSKEEEVEEVTLRINIGTKEIDGTNEMEVSLAAFLEAHPNVTVELINGEQQNTMIAAGDVPDLVRMDSATVPTYANAGIIIPLDDYLAKSEMWNKDDIFSAALMGFTYDGKEYGQGSIWGLPKDWAPYVQYTNKALLEELNIPVPTMEDPWTFTEAETYMEKMVVVNAKDPNILDRAAFDCWNTSFMNYVELELNLQGTSLYTEDFTATNLQDETVRATLQKWFDRYTKHIMNHSLTGKTDVGPDLGLVTGKLGVFDTAQWVVPGLEKNEARTVELDDLIVAPYPIADDMTEATPTCNPTGYGISSTTEHKDLAFELWEYIILGEPSVTRAMRGGNLPIQKSLAEQVSIESPFVSRIYEETVEYAMKDAMVTKVNPYLASGAAQGVFAKYRNLYITGQMTFEAIVTLMEKDLQTLIDEGVTAAQ